MNTKTFEQFDVMTEIQLAAVEGGGMEWIGDVLGAIGNAAHPVNPVSYTHLTLPTNREV